MRWLVVSPYLPHPAIGHGGGTAVFQVCRALARIHDTHLLCLRRENERGLERTLEDAGVTVEGVDFRSDQASGPARLGLIADRAAAWMRARAGGRPLMVEKYDRAALHARLRARIDAFEPDAVQVEYGFMAPYARTATARATAGRPHVFLNTHEAVSLVRLRRTARAARGQRQRHARDLAAWAAHEAGFPTAAHSVLAVTERDRRVFEAMTGASNLMTVPLGTDTGSLPVCAPGDADGPPRVLFVGSFGHPPNVDAARALCDVVAPAVWERRPDTVFDVVGGGAPAWLRARASDERIRVLGFVDDLDATFARAWVCVAPLVSGGGIKIKVLETMGRGAALVGTPIAAEGIDEEGRAHRSVATPEDMGPAVADLIDDAGARRDLGRRARAWIEERYAWDAIVGRLTGIVQSSQARQSGTEPSRP